MNHVIAMSGPIAVGKSAVIAELERRAGAVRVSTRSLIQSLRDVSNDRGPLQAAGEQLDRETDGRWVVDALDARDGELARFPVVVVDSVRIQKQVDRLRERFGRVIHVHLTARAEVLERRFADRMARGDAAVREFANYAEARVNPTEAGVEALASLADLTIDTSDLEPSQVAARVVDRLGL